MSAEEMSVASAAPPAGVNTKVVGDQIKETSRSAWTAFKVFALSPVGGLDESFRALGGPAALRVGVFFGVVSAVALAVSAKLVVNQVNVLKVGLFGLILYAGFVGASFITRNVFRGRSGNIESDAFAGGASLLPLAMWAIVAAVLGIANVEVILFVGAAAATYMILMSYSALTKLGGVAESLAAPATAASFAAAAWLVKVLLASAM